MSLPRKTRGEWRPIYESLATHPEFVAFSKEAKLVFYTLKMSCGALGIRAWPGLEAALSELASMTIKEAKRAIDELGRAQWIVREGSLVWIVEGLENEPQLSHGTKHQTYVANALAGLPSCAIVRAFKKRYQEFLPVSHRVSDTLSDGLSNTPPDTTTPTTSLTTSTSPSLTTTTNPPGDTNVGGRWLVMAANKGILEKYGGQPSPILSCAGSTAQAFEAIAAAGVDLNFAADSIYDYAKTLKVDRPPRHLSWFTQMVLDKWAAHCARRDASGFTPSANSNERTLSSFDAHAISYAQGGDIEFQAYCDANNLTWRKVA